MMRMLFSALALLVVVLVVMKLTATQVQTLKPAAGPSGAAASGASPTQQAADQVRKAIEQGAAMRAADAASQ